MIPLVKPFIPPREVLMPALEAILYSGYIAEGEPVYEFERQFADYIQNPNVLALHSGTDALHLALLLCGVEKGDEVISTAMTAEPTNTSIVMTGAKVVWADVDKANGLIDPVSVRACITKKTKAIIVVHYAGMVCDLDAFGEISREFKIPVIEDAAHALGAEYKGHPIGSNSPYTIFSLQAIKHMTTVDGGFLTFREPANLPRARKMRWFGLDKGKSRLENDITEVGFKYAMNNVNATIGLEQMKFVRAIVEKYKSNGSFYDSNLRGIDGVQLVTYSNNTHPSYWLYTMKVEKRDEFISALQARGIMASPLHHRNDLHSIFKDSKKELPNLNEFYSQLIHIPCGWWVSDENRQYIVDAIKKGW
ncbi:MAG: DegT/DnrJ/EryC1/StrS family aminotransferase [Niabella sp.]|nr:DegT/DnrJ/EryC1/StrS family aminotransferase [Niabella sp.]